MNGKKYLSNKYFQFNLKTKTILRLTLSKRNYLSFLQSYNLYKKFIERRRQADNVFLNKKKSETLVILGSGESINKISEEEYNKLKLCDTFAMNFWCYHSFVPDFYCFEGFYGSIDSFNLWKSRVNSEQYSNTIFMGNARGVYKTLGNLAESFLTFPENVQRTLIYYKCNPIFVSQRQQFGDKHIKRFKSSKSPTGPFQTFKGSLSIAIQFGYIMGYKRLVLYGVDLNNSGYFWKNWNIVSHIKTNAGKVDKDLHDTAKETKFSKGIQSYIYFISENIFKPKGILLQVANKNSLLYPTIPYGRV